MSDECKDITTSLNYFKMNGNLEATEQKLFWKGYSRITERNLSIIIPDIIIYIIQLYCASFKILAIGQAENGMFGIEDCKKLKKYTELPELETVPLLSTTIKTSYMK